MSSVGPIEATPPTPAAKFEAPVTRGGERWLPYLLILPALAILISLIIPFIIGIYWSMTDYKLTSTLPKQFIGLRNYQALLQDAAFWNSMRVTLTYTVIALLVQLPLGLAVAVAAASFIARPGKTSTSPSSCASLSRSIGACRSSFPLP